MITYPNLYHLKYFADAVTLGSISAAAQKNFVTHPAISRAILALEKHLGVALLEHRKKTFKPTKKAYEVAKQAQDLLSVATEFGKMNKKAVRQESIKIAISRTLADVYLAPFLQNLKQEFPSITAQVRFGTTNEIIEAVANRSVDLGFTIGTQNFATLRQTAIRQGEFLLVQKNTNKQEQKEKDASSFLLTEPRPETERLRAGYRKRFGEELPVLFEISSWEAIAQLVQKGLGVGLLPDISVKTWKRDSFKISKPSWFECPYEVYVHSLKTQPQNGVLEFARNSLT